MVLMIQLPLAVKLEPVDLSTSNIVLSKQVIMFLDIPFLCQEQIKNGTGLHQKLS